MSRNYLIERQARLMSVQLLEQIEKGEVTLESLKERFLKIPMPQANVIELSPIETFIVSSGSLRVTDPCYDTETWCAGTVDDVSNGTWSAFAGTAHCESDLEWSAERRAKLINDLKLEPSVSEAVRVFGEKDSSGRERTEEDIQRLARLISTRLLDESISELLSVELVTAAGQVGRVNYIHIHHADHAITEMDDTWVRSDIHVGVDSGQAGFFDLKQFEDQLSEGRYEAPKWEAFYKRCCNLTLETKYSFGVIEFGAISSSGYGDGGYPLFLKRDEQGKVIAARIVFISQSDEEDEE